ncbi:MAG: hypothetical protein HWE10_12135 [Gammaproteobacteria bacterium]|nr:hypothetical protein [Gammaproteobacteria bacterium]
MELKNIFRISLVAASVSLAACGGDINITPTVNDNSTVDNSVGDNSNNVTNNNAPEQDVEVVCASYESDVGTVEGIQAGDDCLYNDSFASKNISITSNITFEELPNGGVHVFDFALQIGADGDTTTGFEVPENGPTMTVKPGATLAFKSGEAIIRIARGAKIQANGTFDKPITFTSANAFPRLDTEGTGPLYADWGGIIINGNGITDQCTDAERAAATCNVASEGITSYFGGNDNTDSSGSISYAKIWYAGSGPRTGGEGDDLNSLTLNAVGSGSSFEFLHVHQGFDDGIEIFGGASTLSNIVVTDTQDDSFDFDAGWQGSAEFLFVQHGTVTLADGTIANMGNGGFETDGRKGTTSAEAPVTNPTIANVTVITTDAESVRDSDPSTAFKFDDEIKSNYHNVLIVKETGANTQCIRHSSDGEKEADEITFEGSVMACAAEFVGEATFMSGSEPAELTGTAKTEWFDRGGLNQRVAADADVLAADGFSTNSTSTAITIDPSATAATAGVGANYIGAVSDATAGSVWYQWVEAAVAAAAQD